MTNRENALIALRGRTPERVPCYYDSCQIMLCSAIREAPAFGCSAGFDGYGVHQTATASAGGAYTPTPGYGPVVKDVEAWREQIILPDPEAIDWEETARLDARRKPVDRENFVQDIFYAKGLFERLHFLLGFEEALVQIMMEPELVYDMVGAITDNKIKHIKKIAKYYKPDIITSHDDFAHHKGLFFSVETFREIFKPHLKRLIDAVHEEGILYKQHCCGKMEDLAGEFIELGIDALDPVQPMNDIPRIKSILAGRAGVMGGLDIQGVVDSPEASEEQIRREVRRCIDQYGENGGYMIYGASVHMYNPDSYKPGGRLHIVCDECRKYGNIY